MPYKRPWRESDVPPWLELGTEARGGSVVERMIAGPQVCDATSSWLAERGFSDADFHGLCDAYDAARDAGHAPERALELAIAGCR
jgi:hypothetical protein